MTTLEPSLDRSVLAAVWDAYLAWDQRRKGAMTDQEVLDALRSETPLNAARRAFSSACGQIEQAHQQRQPCSPIEMRRMEFEAVRRIAAALGVQVPEFAAAEHERAYAIAKRWKARAEDRSIKGNQRTSLGAK